MTASRTSRAGSRRRPARARKAAPRIAAAAAKEVKPVSKLVPAPQVFFRLCKAGWAVIVDKIPNMQGTRFVCPFCPLSHRVPGPVRGFRKFRRAQWVKLRRVEE
ncbi:MAG: hypothetical protein WB869_00320 [Candidatus Acidiferrales bacterium]